MNWVRKNYQGIIAPLIIAAISWVLGIKVPLVGGPLFGIIIGILVGNSIKKYPKWTVGLTFMSGKVLKSSIVLLGFGLSLFEVLKAGKDSFFVMLVTIATAFLAAYSVGILLKVPYKLKSLIGVGTAICGGSAIAALTPVIDADEREVAYSISTIFILNIVGVIVFPIVAHLLQLSDRAFGLWAGTAINDTSSVVAAGYSYSSVAGDYAVIVKLVRTMMIIPVCILFSIFETIKKSKSTQSATVRINFVSLVPWFVILFMCASVINSIGIIDKQFTEWITVTGKFLMTAALAAIGLKTDMRKMVKTGFKPFALGVSVWIVVAVTGLVVQIFIAEVK